MSWTHKRLEDHFMLNPWIDADVPWTPMLHRFRYTVELTHSTCRKFTHSYYGCLWDLLIVTINSEWTFTIRK